MTTQETLSALQSIIYAKLPETKESRCSCGACDLMALRDIQLADVLRVIGGGYAVTSYGQFIKDMNCCGEFSELDDQWDLSKDLSGQSEPTKTFLLNLLT